jgi:hypothetical protein
LPTTSTTTIDRDRRSVIARKLLKRSYHTLRELGEEALQPA